MSVKKTMKALVLKQYNELVIEEAPTPEPKSDEVLVEVRACGICGSDVHGMDGSTGRRKPPVIMGHEASGVIAAVGKDTADWRIGDRVTFDSTIYCGKCHFCRGGITNLCDSRRVLGVSCEEYQQAGAFAEYVAVPQRILYRLPDGLSFESAAMVEPLSVAFHAVKRTPVNPGDTAVVIGAGVIGLLCIQSLRAAGCAKVFAVDIDSERLALACSLGADEGLKADEADVAGEVHSRTSGRGADVAFEAVGLSSTVQSALSALRKGGSLALVGNLSPKIDLPLQAVVTREITLYGSCASCGEYAECLGMMARGAVNVEPLISAVGPLAEGAKWFKRLYEREAGLIKVILVP